MGIQLMKESSQGLVPGIFMINFLIGVIRLPLLCRSGISFIIASLHLEEFTIAIATSLKNRRILHYYIIEINSLWMFLGICETDTEDPSL